VLLNVDLDPMITIRGIRTNGKDCHTVAFSPLNNPIERMQVRSYKGNTMTEAFVTLTGIGDTQCEIKTYMTPEQARELALTILKELGDK